MQPYQFLHQRETDSGALMRSPDLALDSMEALEHARNLICRNPCAGIAHHELHAATVRRESKRDSDFTVEGIFERIRQQIENNLFPHRAVDVRQLRQRLTINLVAKTRLLHGRTKGTRKFGGVSGQIRRLENAVIAACFDSREVEQRIDQPQQAKAVAMYQFDFVTAYRDLIVIVGTPEQIFQRAQHQGKRRTEFVTGIRKES